MGSYETTVGILADELDRVEQVFRGLSPDDWRMPTKLVPVDPSLPHWTVYDYAYTMVQGKTPADMPHVLHESFSLTISQARAVPADTVGPGYFAPMRVDEFVASRIVEAVVHGIDLTQALGRDYIASTDGIKVTASILDDLLARRTVGRRPADLSDDLDWILAASGREPFDDNRLPLIG